jgi:hypothetical protein
MMLLQEKIRKEPSLRTLFRPRPVETKVIAS